MSENTLKLMIVDDEHLARDLFKRCLNWQELGILISREASGAQEALELVEQEIPDIIFTDICMPYMDGIDLSAIIREKYPWVKIVILTGHDEFEYAKRSIQVGVTEFVLKPIHDAEIKKVVLGLKEKIAAERAERDEFQHIKQQLADNQPYLKEKFFNELLQNKFSISEIGDQLKYFQIELASAPFQVALFEITLANMEGHTGAEEQLILGMQARALLAEYYGGKSHIFLFFDYQQRLVVLNNDPAINMVILVESMKSLLKSQLHCCVTIGIGGSYRNSEEISSSYREAVEALNYKLLAGKDQIISYHDLNLLPQETHPVNFQHDEFVFLIKAGCGEKAADWLELFFNGIGADPNFTVDSLRAKTFMILAGIMNTIDGLGIRMGDIFGGALQPYEGLLKIDTLPEMQEYIKDLVLTVTNAVKNLHDKKERRITKEVQEYLQNNLADEALSLTRVAKEFYLNPSYLSRIFKQATGMTFVEFLTKIRMEMAIKLLREADKKAYQIGEAVGIPDPHYFGICFKKFTGMSIHEFRKT